MMTKSRNLRAPRRPWTEVELEMLRRHYADSLTRDLAEAIGRPVTQVYSRAHKLGLAKNEAFFASDESGRKFRGGLAGVRSQFKPGAVPWNKGTHYVSGGRSAETRFKPGVRPHTWKPVGSYRINADGYLEQKVSDTRYTPRDWRGVHSLVWEQSNGPVPEGSVVVFRPGRKTTRLELITLDAVECITRRELLARNSVHNMPPELVQITQLLLDCALVRDLMPNFWQAREDAWPEDLKLAAEEYMVPLEEPAAESEPEAEPEEAEARSSSRTAPPRARLTAPRSSPSASPSTAPTSRSGS